MGGSIQSFIRSAYSFGENSSKAILVMATVRVKRVVYPLLIAVLVFCLLSFQETEYFYDWRIAKQFSKTAVNISNQAGDIKPNDAMEDRVNSINISSTLAACSDQPNTLKGRISVNLSQTNIDPQSSRIQFGGSWQPTHCKPTVKVAILIPYRNRAEQLRVFLSHMHPIFQRQLLSYRIFVIEQLGKVQFNKGAIYNIGFNETLRYDDYDCYIFHDVDLLSENDKNYYGCPSSPRHMSVAIDKFKYRLPYATLFGGIQAFKKFHYIFVNGYSNRYWGWGVEDDDLYKRIVSKGFKLTRPSAEIGRYVMNQRQHYRSDSMNQQNYAAYRLKIRQDDDGLSNIKHLKFTTIVQNKQLYTLVSIDLLKPK